MANRLCLRRAKLAEWQVLSLQWPGRQMTESEHDISGMSQQELHGELTVANGYATGAVYDGPLPPARVAGLAARDELAELIWARTNKQVNSGDLADEIIAAGWSRDKPSRDCQDEDCVRPREHTGNCHSIAGFSL